MLSLNSRHTIGYNYNYNSIIQKRGVANTKYWGTYWELISKLYSCKTQICLTKKCKQRKANNDNIVRTVVKFDKLTFITKELNNMIVIILNKTIWIIQPIWGNCTVILIFTAIRLEKPTSITFSMPY